jgi:hypothetical protein
MSPCRYFTYVKCGTVYAKESVLNGWRSALSVSGFAGTRKLSGRQCHSSRWIYTVACRIIRDKIGQCTRSSTSCQIVNVTAVSRTDSVYLRG